MTIKTSHFCALATSASFLAWLNDFNREICADLVKHLQQKASCKANADKMKDILDKIKAVPDGEKKLITFLSTNSPHVLETTPPTATTNPVFPHYDPSLLTLPRRLILNTNSPDTVKDFAQNKAAIEFVIVDDKAYVEYVPHELAHLIGKIPVKNWLVKQWRARNKQ